MSEFTDRCKRELKLAGLFDKDSDYEGMLGKAVMELCRVFSKQGHSGFSALLTAEIFNRLVRGETLSPITSNPDEWMLVDQIIAGENARWQNRRSPSVFSRDGGKTWYDVDEEMKKRKEEEDANNG